MSHEIEITPSRLLGKTILAVEVVAQEIKNHGLEPGMYGYEDPEPGYIVIELAGLRLYADRPTLYLDDEED